MSRSIPDVQTLVALVAECLDEEICPVLSGAVRYRARVALNILRIVCRELELGAALEAEEARDLRAVMGGGDDASIERLIEHIEGVAPPVDDGELRRFLSRSLERALEINNPRWLERSPREPS